MPERLLEVLRYRLDNHGQRIRRLEELHPEVVMERVNELRRDVDRVMDALDPTSDRYALRPVYQATDRVNRRLGWLMTTIVGACITFTLSVLVATGHIGG